MPRKDIPHRLIRALPKRKAQWIISPLNFGVRKPRRKPPGSAPALVEPPRGPLPLQGGAEAQLEYDA